MTPLAWLAVVLMSAGALACALFPLFRHNGDAGQPTATLLAACRMVAAAAKSEIAGDPSELAMRREGLYAALRDLHYDLETGKLTEADYAAARQPLIHQAAVILARMDALRPPDLLRTRDDEIERAVSGLRRIGSHGAQETLAE